MLAPYDSKSRGTWKNPNGRDQCFKDVVLQNDTEDHVRITRVQNYQIFGKSDRAKIYGRLLSENYGDLEDVLLNK